METSPTPLPDAVGTRVPSFQVSPSTPESWVLWAPFLHRGLGEGTQRRARLLLHPLPTQHPRGRKACLPRGPRLHLAVSPSLDTLSFPSSPVFIHSPTSSQPKAISHFIGDPNPTSTLGVPHA